jgi:hypothetical protein
MAKKFEKKLLSSAMAVALVAGFGYAGSANAIHLAEDGIGQVLMSPLYLAEYGYNTKVAIVNTRNDVAVKVRVALRSHVNSIEFDFLCYMTPSDVCRFEIVRGADGQAYLESSDDSLLADEPTDSPTYNPIFASQCATQAGTYCKDGKLRVKAYDYHLPDNTGGKVYAPNPDPKHMPNIGADAHTSNPDSNEIGHLEVVGAWGAMGTVIYRPGASITIKEGMSKAELYKIFGPIVPEAAGGNGVAQNRARLAGYAVGQNEAAAGYAVGRLVAGVCTVTPDILDASEVGAGDVAADFHGAPCINTDGSALTDTNGSRIRSTDSSWIRLTGTVEMESYASGDRMGLRMAPLAGDVWDELTPAAHVPSYGLYSYSNSADAGAFEYAFDGRVVSDPSYDVSTTVVMNLGENMGRVRAGFGAVAASYDNIVEIENALAATNLRSTYENDGTNMTNLVVTFPTKYRHLTKEAYGDPTNHRILVRQDGSDAGDVCASEMTAPALDDGELHADARLFDGRYYYPPFRAESSGAIQYSMTVWNDQEVRDSSATSFPIFSGRSCVPGVDGACTTQTITDEVNYMWINWPTRAGFTSGWFNLGLAATQGCQYAGAPVLAYSHKTQNKAGNFANSWLVPLSKD